MSYQALKEVVDKGLEWKARAELAESRLQSLERRVFAELEARRDRLREGEAYLQGKGNPEAAEHYKHGGDVIEAAIAGVRAALTTHAAQEPSK